MRVIVTGASGMLGKDIFTEFFDGGHLVYGVDRVRIDRVPEKLQRIGDLTSKEFTCQILEEIDPDIIIHCAAIVNLKTCEENRALADNIHVSATKLLAQYKPSTTKLIYISTDSVFNGEKGNYLETDTPNPINYYAKSKLAGEQVTKLNPNHIVVRTNIFGFNIPLKGSLSEWAINNLENNNSIKGFTDIFFNAIYTKHLAKIISILCRQDYKGTINIASSNTISKYDFLLTLLQKMKFPQDLLTGFTSNDISFTIPRPKLTDLNTDQIQKITYIPSVEEGITDLVNDYNRFNKSNYDEKN